MKMQTLKRALVVAALVVIAIFLKFTLFDAEAAGGESYSVSLHSPVTFPVDI